MLKPRVYWNYPLLAWVDNAHLKGLGVSAVVFDYCDPDDFINLLQKAEVPETRKYI